MIEVLLCSEQCMHADIKLSESIIRNEQILADVEQLDKLEKGMFLQLKLSSLKFVYGLFY